jgi:hypothetical protein
MEATTAKKIETSFIIMFLVVMLVLIGIYIYRHFLEFNNSEVDKLIKDEVKTFPPDAQPAIIDVLQDGTNEVLSNRYLLRMLRTKHKSTGISKEKLLVDAAVGVAQSHRYLS